MIRKFAQQYRMSEGQTDPVDPEQVAATEPVTPSGPCGGPP